MKFILNLSFVALGLLLFVTGSVQAKSEDTLYFNESRTESVWMGLQMRKKSCDRAEAAAMNRLNNNCKHQLKGELAQQKCFEVEDPTGGKIPFFEQHCVVTCETACAIKVAQ